MFSDSQINLGKDKGCIEVICGSMFSGKTEELLRRLRRAAFAKLKVAVYKPKLDNRYDHEKVVSHDANNIASVTVNSATEILDLIADVDVVAIDEAQFFDQDLVVVVDALANRGLRVIIAGLDMDYLGNPFEPMPQLLAIAEQISKVQAICVACGENASYSYRKSADVGLVKLGEKKDYVPLCRTCFGVKMK